MPADSCGKARVVKGRSQRRSESRSGINRPLLALRRRFDTASGALTVLAALAISSPARNADAGDLARARKLFADGVRLYQSGDWEGARRLFREADSEHHAPAIVYNIGLAEERLGHPQAAVDRYEAYLAEIGDKGEFATSAATAIAQIKARSTRLRLETRPPGGRLFIDGTALEELAPTSVLVPPGHHVVVAQGEQWRGERVVEVRGTGDVVVVVLEASTPEAGAPNDHDAPTSSSAPALPPASDLGPPAAEPPKTAPPKSSESAPDGMTWGAAFAVVPMYLLGVTTPAADNARPAPSIIAGPLLELGLALTDRFEFLARGLAGLGPDAKPSYGYMGGPGLSYRVARSAWLGATFLGGQIETSSRGVRYGTDLVFGAMFEASFVVLRKAEGEWLVGVQPSILMTESRQDNTALFLPVSFGYRAY